MITSPDKTIYSSTTIIGTISVRKTSIGLFKVTKNEEVLGIYENRKTAFDRIVNVLENSKSEISKEIFLICHETSFVKPVPDISEDS